MGTWKNIEKRRKYNKENYNPLDAKIYKLGVRYNRASKETLETEIKRTKEKLEILQMFLKERE